MIHLLRGSKYANVTSTLALVVALSSTGAYAATTIGSAQIKNGAVRSIDLKNKGVASKDLANNAVTGAKVKDGSLRGKDFAPGQLPAGPAGPAGTAVAFADVADSGAIQASTVPKGITAAMISHTAGSGLYCFDQTKLGFVPKSAMVAADNSFSANDTNVSVLTFNTNPPDNCQVRVRTTNNAGTLTDRPFVIWFL